MHRVQLRARASSSILVPQNQTKQVDAYKALPCRGEKAPPATGVLALCSWSAWWLQGVIYCGHLDTPAVAVTVALTCISRRPRFGILPALLSSMLSVCLLQCHCFWGGFQLLGPCSPSASASQALGPWLHGATLGLSLLLGRLAAHLLLGFERPLHPGRPPWAPLCQCFLPLLSSSSS